MAGREAIVVTYGRICRPRLLAETSLRPAGPGVLRSFASPAREDRNGQGQETGFASIDTRVNHRIEPRKGTEMIHLSRLLIVVTTVLVGLLSSPLPAQEKSVRPGINKNYLDPDLNVQNWLERFEREGREIYDQREAIVDACELRPGMAVADVGAGTGLFTGLFAQKVGKKGRVYAVDIAPRFVQSLRERAEQEKWTNVEAVQCRVDDACLPPASVDLVFICDTYHHFEFPAKTMGSIHRALRPGGRLVVIDFRRVEGESSQWILDHVRAGQEVVVKEIEECGFTLASEKDLLTDNYFLMFRREE